MFNAVGWRRNCENVRNWLGDCIDWMRNARLSGEHVFGIKVVDDKLVFFLFQLRLSSCTMKAQCGGDPGAG